MFLEYDRLSLKADFKKVCRNQRGIRDPVALATPDGHRLALKKLLTVSI